jgi:hypothetical protein
VVAGTLLSLESHVLLLVSVGQTVLEKTVDQRLVSELGAVAHVGEVVGGVGHALSSGSNDDLGIASYDGLGTDNQGLDGRGAHLVDGRGYGRLGEASANGTLAGGVLTKAGDRTLEMMEGLMARRVILCGEDVADEDFLDIGGLDTSAVNGSCTEMSDQTPKDLEQQHD